MSLDFTLTVSGREGFEQAVSGTIDSESDVVSKINDTVDAGSSGHIISVGFPADDTRLHALLLIPDGDCTFSFKNCDDVEVGSVAAYEDVPVLYYTGIGFDIADLVSGDVSYIEVDNSTNSSDLIVIGRIASNNSESPSPSP